MADSSGSVSIDVETISLSGKEHIIETSYGPISVSVYGDGEKPALVTYPDVALNYMSCFQGLFFCSEAASLLLHNFCIYHISPPGHELGAGPISSDLPVLSVDELADQIADLLDFFGIDSVMCMGVTAGAYILTLFATKYRERVLGLILISPLCKAPTWTEWLYNKVMLNMLYYYGMCNLIKEYLLQRYFSKEVRGGPQALDSDIVQACRSLLDERQSTNVWRFLRSINGRRDLTEQLKKLQCRLLIFVGENSPFHSEALHMTTKLEKKTQCLGRGFGMWVYGDRRAAPCNADTHGVLPYGIWDVQAIPVEHKPSKSIKSILHLPGPALTRENGVEVETYKDQNVSSSLRTEMLCKDKSLY